ncbi:MAG: hypothetical protein N3E40_00335 [Dehalococcoidia bacterium]|nr:hypothetical protein [Dehalococcoidia bacterium]
MKSRTGNVLRTVAIVLMGMATVLTLLGGIGTSCVAWNAPRYGPTFTVFVPFMAVYQNFVYAGVITGIVGAVAVYALVKGYKWAYWVAVGTLLVSLAAAGLQMFYTSTLKGVSFFQTPPTNIRFYVCLLALVFFLVLLIPGLKKRAAINSPWESKDTGAMAGGMAAIVTGVIALTTPFWAAESHTIDGNNLVYVLETPLMVFGWVLALTGIILMSVPGFSITRGQIGLARRRRWA